MRVGKGEVGKLHCLALQASLSEQGASLPERGSALTGYSGKCWSY